MLSPCCLLGEYPQICGSRLGSARTEKIVYINLENCCCMIIRRAERNLDGRLRGRKKNEGRKEGR